MEMMGGVLLGGFAYRANDNWNSSARSFFLFSEKKKAKSKNTLFVCFSRFFQSVYDSLAQRGGYLGGRERDGEKNTIPKGCGIAGGDGGTCCCFINN